MKTKKQKFLIGILAILLLLLLAGIFLWKSGWLLERVDSGGNSGFLCSNTPQNEENIDTGEWRDEQIGSYDIFTNGVNFEYNIGATIRSGRIKLTVYDMKGLNPYNSTVQDYELVKEAVYTETGNYVLSYNDLKEDTMYYTALFSTTDSDYSIDVSNERTLFRWQKWYDKYVAALPFIDKKYDPDIIFDEE